MAKRPLLQNDSAFNDVADLPEEEANSFEGDGAKIFLRDDGGVDLEIEDGDADPADEGSWTEGALNPSATLSCFPYAEMTCYKHPLRRQGISDTEATRTLVVVDNSSFRSTYEQMRQAGAIILDEGVSPFKDEKKAGKGVPDKEDEEKPESSHLKQPVNGRVYPSTPALRARKDLIPCDKNGKPV